MPISKEEVRHIAELARLRLTEEETETYSRQLGDILNYVEQLNELDLGEIEPLSSVLDLVNVQRRDEIRRGLDRTEVMANAGSSDQGFFKVPRVVGEDDDT